MTTGVATTANLESIMNMAPKNSNQLTRKTAAAIVRRAMDTMTTKRKITSMGQSTTTAASTNSPQQAHTTSSSIGIQTVKLKELSQAATSPPEILMESQEAPPERKYTQSLQAVRILDTPMPRP